jgi:hypothetical protein
MSSPDSVKVSNSGQGTHPERRHLHLKDPFNVFRRKTSRSRCTMGQPWRVTVLNGHKAQLTLCILPDTTPHTPLTPGVPASRRGARRCAAPAIISNCQQMLDGFWQAITSPNADRSPADDAPSGWR